MWNLGDSFGGGVGAGEDDWAWGQLLLVVNSILSWDIVKGLIVMLLVFSLLRYFFMVLRPR